MKKLSFLGMALLAGSALSAQSLMIEAEQLRPTKNIEISRVTPVSRNVNRGAAIFTEDFANGLNGNNGIGAWTATGTDADLWLQDFDGPSGQFSGPTQIVPSETVDNGFMIFDADLSNTLPGGGFGQTAREGSIQTPVINLVGQTSVVLNFTQSYRWCCTQAHLINLEISTDGGMTFPAANTVQINEGFGANDNVNGLFTVNMTNIAADQAAVVVKFSWTAGGASHYFWQIDDVVIESAPENDLELLSFECLLGDTIDGFQQNYSFGQEPDFMASERWFMAIVKNNADAPRNAYMTLDIDNGLTAITVGDPANFKTLQGFGAIDTIFIDYTPTLYAQAHYNVIAKVNTVDVPDEDDANPLNNILPSKFTITRDILAANSGDYGNLRTHDNQFNTDDNDATPEISQEVDYYNRWIQFEELEIIGVRTVFTDESQDGVLFTWGIYGTTESNNQLDKQSVFWEAGNWFLENGDIADRGIDASKNGQTQTYRIKMGVLDDDFNLALVDTSIIIPEDPLGSLYAVDINLPQEGGVSGIYGAETGGGQGNRQMSLQVGPFDAGGAQATYLSAGMNIIELVIKSEDNFVSVDEKSNRPEFYLGQNRPNPFDGNTTVTYQLNKKSNNISFEVFDVTGKQVMNLNEGSRVAGQYQINLNSADFNTGLYYYSLTVNGQKLTRKMVITK